MADGGHIRRGLREEGPGLLLLALLMWAPFLARALAGRSSLSLPLMHDVGLQWVPFRMFIARSLGQGMFPLWASQVYAGFPFAAFSHSGVFYPPGWLFLLGDYARVVNFFYPIHLCIAGFGVYALGRTLGLGRLAAWLAAFCYCFTVKPFYFIHFLPATCSNVWAPWFLYSALALLKSGSRRQMALAGAFIALQVLGGDVESTSYGLVISGLFLVMIAPSQGISHRRFPLLVFPLVVAGIICAIQVLPLAELSRHFVRNQGVTFSYFSQRQVPPGVIFALLLPLKGATVNEVEFLDAPSFYLGAVTVALALFAAVKRLDRSSRALGWLALFASVWAFGSLGIANRLQYSLPVLGRFGSPEHAFFMGQLFLVLLAGQSVQALLSSADPRTVRNLGIAVMAAALVRTGAGPAGVELLESPWLLLALATAAMGYGLYQYRRQMEGRWRHLALAVVAFQIVDLYGLAFIYLPSTDPAGFGYLAGLKELAARVRASNSRYIMVSRDWLVDSDLLYHTGIGLDMDAVDGWITVPPRNYVEVLKLIDDRAVRFVDGKLDYLGFVGMRDSRFIDASSMPVMDLLSLRYIIDRQLPLKFSSPYPLFLSPADVHKREIVAGTPSMFHPDQAGDEAGLARIGVHAAPYELISYKIFVTPGDRLGIVWPRIITSVPGPAGCTFETRVVEGGTVVSPLTAGLDTLTPAEARGREKRTGSIPLDTLAGREVELEFIFNCPRDRTDLVLEWDSPLIFNPGKPIALDRFEVTPDIKVYQNREALPRAFVVHDFEIVAGSEERLLRLGRADRDFLSRTVLLERDPGMWPAPAGTGAGSARDSATLVSRRPGEEVYDVSSRGPGLMFISDQYYPGWRAEVRGRSAPIFRADHCFRAVPVPDGKSVVRMVFVPASFRVGLWTTVAGLAGVMAMIGIGYWRKRPETPPDPARLPG